MKSELDSFLIKAKSDIDLALSKFVAQEIKELLNIGEELIPVGEALSRFILDGGKRLRPLFALLGYLGGGNEPSDAELNAAAALELIHVCALIHDDLMDGSDTRRGAPSIHKEFERWHRQNGRSGSPQQYGASAAILLGDLALVWAEKALYQSGLKSDQLLRATSIFSELQIELMAGQFLDVHEQSSLTSNIDRSRKIARFKSGKYTIERPLHFGAAISGDSSLQKPYSNYGIPLGEAFQLRDDILGVFGESKVTGKPTGDDLLEGKRTVLIAKTFELAGAQGALTLTQVLGNRDASPEMIEKCKVLIKDCGALTHVEKLIEDLVSQSLNAVSGLKNELLLARMAEIVTKRES